MEFNFSSKPNRRYLLRLGSAMAILGLVAHIYPYYVAVAWIVGFAFGGFVKRVTHGAWGELS